MPFWLIKGGDDALGTIFGRGKGCETTEGKDGWVTLTGVELSEVVELMLDILSEAIFRFPRVLIGFGTFFLSLGTASSLLSSRIEDMEMIGL